MENPVVKNAIYYIKHVFSNDFSGHDYLHTMRVYRLATEIALKENADLIVVQLAALLHDVDDLKISPNTYKNKDRAKSFLKKSNLSPTQVNQIIEVINEVSFRENKKSTPNSLESKCVQDADRLDAMGAIGIARAFAFGGTVKRQIYNPEIKPRNLLSEKKVAYEQTTSINHFYEKLLLLKDLMNTKTAIEIAESRDKYMRDFLKEFFKELNCND